MQWHKYEIIINEPAEKSKKYCYDYSATRGRNIKLHLSRRGIKIEISSSALYESEKIIVSTNYIFSDAIKKALLLYLILYSKNIQIKKLNVKIDGLSESIPLPDDGCSPPIFSLVIGELHHPFPKEWASQSFIDFLLSKSTSKYLEDSRWASLFAAICAKNRQYEVERFIYFWMSFNGIYDYLYKEIRPKSPLSETQELILFVKLYGLGFDFVGRKDSSIIAREVISVITRADLSKISSVKEIPKEIEMQIAEILSSKGSKKYNILPKGYLLVCLPYYFRCKYFHADRTLPLFCYADERELKCLHLINTFLEEFIDKNLYLLFDDTYTEQTFKEKIQLIANNKL